MQNCNSDADGGGLGDAPDSNAHNTNNESQATNRYSAFDFDFSEVDPEVTFANSGLNRSNTADIAGNRDYGFARDSLRLSRTTTQRRPTTLDSDDEYEREQAIRRDNLRNSSLNSAETAANIERYNSGRQSRWGPRPTEPNSLSANSLSYSDNASEGHMTSGEIHSNAHSADTRRHSRFPEFAYLDKAERDDDVSSHGNSQTSLVKTTANLNLSENRKSGFSFSFKNGKKNEMAEKRNFKNAFADVANTERDGSKREKHNETTSNGDSANASEMNHGMGANGNSHNVFDNTRGVDGNGNSHNVFDNSRGMAANGGNSNNVFDNSRGMAANGGNSNNVFNNSRGMAANGNSRNVFDTSRGMAANGGNSNNVFDNSRGMAANGDSRNGGNNNNNHANTDRSDNKNKSRFGFGSFKKTAKNDKGKMNDLFEQNGRNNGMTGNGASRDLFGQNNGMGGNRDSHNVMTGSAASRNNGDSRDLFDQNNGMAGNGASRDLFEQNNRMGGNSYSHDGNSRNNFEQNHGMGSNVHSHNGFTDGNANAGRSDNRQSRFGFGSIKKTDMTGNGTSNDMNEGDDNVGRSNNRNSILGFGSNRGNNTDDNGNAGDSGNVEGNYNGAPNGRFSRFSGRSVNAHTGDSSLGRGGSVRRSIFGLLQQDVADANSVPLGEAIRNRFNLNGRSSRRRSRSRDSTTMAQDGRSHSHSRSSFSFGRGRNSGDNARFSFSSRNNEQMGPPAGNNRRDYSHFTHGLGNFSSTTLNLGASLATSSNSRHLAHPRQVPPTAEEMARRAITPQLVNLSFEQPHIHQIMLRINSDEIGPGHPEYQEFKSYVDRYLAEHNAQNGTGPRQDDEGQM